VATAARSVVWQISLHRAFKLVVGSSTENSEIADITTPNSNTVTKDRIAFVAYSGVYVNGQIARVLWLVHFANRNLSCALEMTYVCFNKLTTTRTSQ
jgi:hypothetical protein